MDAQLTRLGFQDPELIRYAVETFEPEDSALAFARGNAERRGLPAVPFSPLEVRHLEVLVAMSGARRAVEIGTRGGYTGISIARGLGASGRLHTFELDPHHAEVARQAFNQANLLCEVVIHVGPALENLPSISREAPFDLVFIDADEVRYPEYLSWATQHLRVGGAVIADNAFAAGKILRPDSLNPQEVRAVNAMKEFNRMVARSGRYRSTILPTSEGLTVAIKVN